MIRTFCLAVVGLTCLVAEALAAYTISTPAVPSGLSGGTSLGCQVLNTGKKPAQVTVEIVGSNIGQPPYAAGPALLDTGTATNEQYFVYSTKTFCRVTGLSSKTGNITYSPYGAGGTLIMAVTAP